MTTITAESKTTESQKAGSTIPTWVNEDIFVDVLRKDISGFKKILKFEPSTMGGAGENYSSIMLRIRLEVELKDGTTKKAAYMVKTILQDEKSAMMMKMMSVFPKETTMYSKYLPEFEEIYSKAGKHVKFGPKFSTFKKNPGVDYILLEDLSPRGFANANRREGLDQDHTESVLRSLAEIHAASAVRFERKGEYDESFVKGIFNEDNKDSLEAMLKSIQEVSLECLAKSEICSKYISQMKKIHSQAADNLIKFTTPDPEDFNVLNHGDLWVNNIMFRHNDEGKLEETVLIDYQLSRYGSPAGDLYYFLLSSTCLDIKLSNFDDFIKYYHDHLVENLKMLGYSKKILTLKDLHMQLLKNGYWAFATVGGVLAGCLLDPTENANIDNFINGGEAALQFQRQLYGNPRFIRQMEHIIPWLDMRGLLE